MAGDVPQACPHCGYCPACGRPAGRYTYPYVWWSPGFYPPQISPFETWLSTNDPNAGTTTTPVVMHARRVSVTLPGWDIDPD